MWLVRYLSSRKGQSKQTVGAWRMEVFLLLGTETGAYWMRRQRARSTANEIISCLQLPVVCTEKSRRKDDRLHRLIASHKWISCQINRRPIPEQNAQLVQRWSNCKSQHDSLLFAEQMCDVRLSVMSARRRRRRKKIIITSIKEELLPSFSRNSIEAMRCLRKLDPSVDALSFV